MNQYIRLYLFHNHSYGFSLRWYNQKSFSVVYTNEPLLDVYVFDALISLIDVVLDPYCVLNKLQYLSKVLRHVKIQKFAKERAQKFLNHFNKISKILILETIIIKNGR